MPITHADDTRAGSLAPRLFAFFVLAAVFLMATIKIGDYDIWFHLKAGEHILATSRINHLDPFSYATADLPWPVHSWLSAVVFYSVYSVGGFPGLVLLGAFTVTAAFFVIYMTMRLFARDEESMVAGAAILLVAAFSLRFRMWVRPHVFEFLLLAAAVYVINLYRVRGGRVLYVLPALQVLWANMHGSHVLGLVVPAIYLAGSLFDLLVLRQGARAEGAPGPGRFARAMAVLIVANAAATLINPDGVNTLLSSFTILSPTLQNINEFQPLTLQHFMGLQLRYTWGLAALVVLGLTGFGLSIAKERRGFDTAGALLFFAFLFMSFKGIRYVAEFSIIAGPVVFRSLTGPLDSLLGRLRRPASAALAAFTLIVVIPLVVTTKTYSFGLGVKDGVFPVKAVDFVERAGLRGRVFNSYAFGDYLLWRWHPERKVFIHGHSRSEVFPAELYQHYLDAHTSSARWKALVRKYDLSFTVLEYYGTDYGGEETMLHLARDPDWAPLYWDRNAIVYARKDGPNGGAVERYGFRLIRPTYLDFSYLEMYLNRGMAGEVIKEYSRLLEISPDNEEAYLGRAYAYFMLGGPRLELARADLEEAARINPRQAMTHSALGLILMRLGDKEGAAREFRTALRLDPRDPAAKSGLERLGR